MIADVQAKHAGIYRWFINVSSVVVTYMYSNISNESCLEFLFSCFAANRIGAVMIPFYLDVVEGQVIEENNIGKTFQ